MSIIEFREPIESDILPLMALARGYKHKYLADSEILPDDPNLLIKKHGFNMEEMQAKRAIVFTVTEPDGSERVIGSADFTDVNHDLTAVLHFIMEPRYIRRFLLDKVYLDALIDRFRVLRVKKFLVVSEFFATTAHKLAEAIGFKKVATLTDIVRQRQQVGDTFQYVVGDLFYYELTRKDLAKAMQAHFIAEEMGEPELKLTQQGPYCGFTIDEARAALEILPKPRKEPKTHVIKQEKSVKRPRAKKPKQPVWNAEQQREERVVQPGLPAGAKGHSKRSPNKRSEPAQGVIAICDPAVSRANEQLSGQSEPFNGWQYGEPTGL